MSFLGRLFPRSGKRIALLRKMTLNPEELQRNNARSKVLITNIESEIAHIMRAKVEERKLALRKENSELTKKVQQALAQLVALETKHGKKQISVPKQNFSTDARSQETPAENVTAASETVKPAKEKKPKKEKPATATSANNSAPAAAAEAPIDVGRLDMRVGKIVDVQRHPEADSLYLEKIDLGEAQPRTIISGLVKFVPIEEMQNRMVVVLCNLKPAKMRGVLSEGMVMCASTAERVEVLSPPAGAVSGDLVHCEGYNRQPDAQLNPKKKIFETCAPDLKTNDCLVACYKGANLHVPGKGNILAQTLKNVQVK